MFVVSCPSFVETAFSDDQRTTNHELKSVMRERLVRFGHTVDVLFLLHRAAASIRRIKQLADETVFHGLFAAAAGIRYDPADRQRVASIFAHFERHLIGSAADTTRFDFKRRS